MAPKKLLVKRHGHMEEFDERKMYASIYSSALNAHLPDEEAESIADKVSKAVAKKLKSVDAITSKDIREAVVEELGEESDIAFLYLNHYNIN